MLTWWLAIRTMRSGKWHASCPSGPCVISSCTLASPLTRTWVGANQWVMLVTSTANDRFVKAM